MTKDKLKNNLLGILGALNVHISEDTRFLVKPIIEPDKKYNSTDDVVRLWAYKEIDFERVVYPLDELMKVLSVIEPKFPLWIKIDLSEYEKRNQISLEISLRFRKPSQLLNKENGYPPFEIKSVESL